MKLRNNKEENKQYDLGLRDPFRNRFLNFKTSFSKKFVRFENLRFLRKTTVWLLIGLIVLLNMLLLNYYTAILPILPNKIPLLNNYIQLLPRLIESSDLYILPLSSVIISAVLVFISIKIFNRKPYYSYFIFTIIILFQSTLLLNLVSLSNQYL